MRGGFSRTVIVGIRTVIEVMIRLCIWVIRRNIMVLHWNLFWVKSAVEVGYGKNIIKNFKFVVIFEGGTNGA